jgi:hypothetical protein
MDEIPLSFNKNSAINVRRHVIKVMTRLSSITPIPTQIPIPTITVTIILMDLGYHNQSQVQEIHVAVE